MYQHKLINVKNQVADDANSVIGGKADSSLTIDESGIAKKGDKS
jgi:hypothetical protein